MARRPSVRSHSKEEVSTDINLIPIMGMICILIPLLVYAFRFYEVKTQPVTAPKMGLGKPALPDEEQKKPLNLTVIITDKGFSIKQEASVAGADADINIEKKTFKDKDGRLFVDYDYPALYSKLMEIKKKFKDETTINIGADMNIKWEVVARTIDAARVQLKKESYDDLDAYSRAEEDYDADGKVKLLFPHVVFVVAD